MEIKRFQMKRLSLDVIAFPEFLFEDILENIKFET